MKVPVVTVEGNTGARKTTLLQKFEESLSGEGNFKITEEHEPMSSKAFMEIIL